MLYKLSLVHQVKYIPMEFFVFFFIDGNLQLKSRMLTKFQSLKMLKNILKNFIFFIFYIVYITSGPPVKNIQDTFKVRNLNKTHYFLHYVLKNFPVDSKT